MDEHIKQAIEVLNKGGMVIYPTDTAFGIGCRMDNEKAIKRLFATRKRPTTQATPVLLDGIGMAHQYLGAIPESVESLMRQYWPGALTLVLPCEINKVPDLVRGGTATLGVRMPNHETALALIHGIGVPLLGPSANFHGDATPYRFEDLNPELVKLVDYVVPGECQTKQASTVVDCSVQPWKILRQGAVKLRIEN
jgi:L-threonylcarbamoyladenylate synthase